MKPEKLVEACTTKIEERALAYALADSMFPNEFLNIAWETYWVNGIVPQRAQFSMWLEEHSEFCKKEMKSGT